MTKFSFTAITLLALMANSFAQEIIVLPENVDHDVNNNSPALLTKGYDIPAGGTLINTADFSLRYKTPQHHSKGTFKRVEVEGLNFGAVETVISTEPSNPWDTQILETITTDIKKGDTLFVTMMARTISSRDETGEGKFTVFAQLNRPPHSKFLESTVPIGRKWNRIHYPFKADRDYPQGATAFGIMLGYRIQTVQIADLKLYNYGQGKKLKDFPVTSSTYSGQDKNVLWRKDAAQRIDKYRKADLSVTVQDSSGKTIKGADVHIAMQRHGFHFGSAISARRLMQQDDNGKKYRKLIENLFSIVVFENDLKWPSWEHKQRRELTLQALVWLEERNIAVRGHCLIWPSWKWTPRDLKNLKDNPDALRKRITDHIREEAGTLKGRIYEWDVINEPYTNHDVMDVLGRDSMISWFKLAQECDPTARLFLNDYSILSAGGTDKRHQKHYEETIQFMIDGGAPISGIGMQSHFGNDATPPLVVYSLLERYSKFKLPIAITEHDINTQDTKMQSAYTRDFMTIAFSHPNVESFLSWGFWAGQHWRPDSAYFDKEWNLTPAGKVWVNLLTKEWWTDEQLKTDSTGTAKIRGFLGDYTITVTHKGSTSKKNITLTKESGSFTVVL